MLSRFLNTAVRSCRGHHHPKRLLNQTSLNISRHLATTNFDNDANKPLTKYTSRDSKESQDGDPILNDLAEKVEQDSRIARRKLTDLNQFRRDLNSVGKEIFLAKMNTKIFSYPDVLTNDRYFELEKKWKMMVENLESKADIFEECMSTESRSPKDILFDLRGIGFYGFMCNMENGGSGLTYTETLKLQEDLAAFDLSLSETISLPHTIAFKAVDAFGTKDQKDRYLEKMASGELISAMCFCEKDCGSDFTASKAATTLSNDEKYFILNGEKTWVCNGPSADVFLVFANHYALTKGSSRAYPCAFLVERGFNGVKVHKGKRLDTSGLKGVEICSVSFENTKIPLENLLKGIGAGVEILTNVFHDQRLSASARMCGALRKLLNMTVSYSLSRRVHGNPLSYYDTTKGKLSEAACYLYALESAVYMTAGIADYQKVQDTSLESAMVKHFAIKASDVICKHCVDIFGASAYLKESPILQLVNDLKAFSTWEGTSNILGFYIALTGIEYAGKFRAADVQVMRNTGKTPLEAFKIYKEEYNLARDKPKLTLKLGDDLHFHLSDPSDVLEEILLRFGGAIFQAMTREGYNLSLKELELDRIANISSYIYVLASSLARASRSFATGYPHTDFEMMAAEMFVHHTSQDIKNQLGLLFKGAACKIDSNMVDVADFMTKLGRYPPVHPTTKNMF